jgi:hypothetical protein
MRTADIKFHELCEEIDYWKHKAKKAEEEAEYYREEYSKLLNENLARSQQGVANALLFALSVKDDEEGNLILDKDSRKQLAERIK